MINTELWRELIIPVILAGSTSYFSFKWGRKKSKEERDKDIIGTIESVVNLLRKELNTYKEEVDALKIIDKERVSTITALSLRIENNNLALKSVVNCNKVTDFNECPIIERWRKLTKNEDFN